MTLQQLKYIIAIDRFRNFARAAEELGVTQPTLSNLLQKLENELDVRIFERSNKSVEPTTIGEKIVRQAKIAVAESERISELIAEEKGTVAGHLNLSVGPTIAPYILPGFIKAYSRMFPQVTLSISELKYDAMLDSLKLGYIDVGMATCGIRCDGILEIPLYSEPFWVYMADDCRQRLPVFKPENLEHGQMWVMKESQCLRESAFSFCKSRDVGRQMYEAGSIETLIRIVDANGGFTIIPEMHLPFLTEEQKRNIRPLEGDFKSGRRISMYIRHDFIRELILQSIAEALMSFIPRKMIEPNIASRSIRI